MSQKQNEAELRRFSLFAFKSTWETESISIFLTCLAKTENRQCIHEKLGLARIKFFIAQTFNSFLKNQYFALKYGYSKLFQNVYEINVCCRFIFASNIKFLRENKCAVVSGTLKPSRISCFLQTYAEIKILFTLRFPRTQKCCILSFWSIENCNINVKI